MDYVMSDIHGCYDKYIRMLEEIKFSDNDKLYILGDLCDRGSQNVAVLQDVMKRKNVQCVLGNHDMFLLKYLKNKKDINNTALWYRNGGEVTEEELNRESEEFKIEVREFLTSLPKYIIYKDNIVLCHAGFINSARKEFNSVLGMMGHFEDDLVWARPHKYGYNITNLDVQFIVGHTPTLNVFLENTMTKHGNTTFIDCGCFHRKGQLGCMCLDTREEFYVR